MRTNRRNFLKTTSLTAGALLSTHCSIANEDERKPGDNTIANHSKGINIPEYTAGTDKTNTPRDINLKHGGNTGVRKTGEKKSERQEKEH